MDIVTAIVLGFVQGLTEFLPISSSGHLILARELLGFQTDYGLAVDAVLQLATVLAVLIYFWRDFVGMARTSMYYVQGKTVETQSKYLLWALVLGTIPALVLGLLLENSMETTFRSAELVAWMLIGGSLLFLLAEYVAKRHTEKKELTPSRGLLIGFFQSLALIPGMSRSGSTISGGLFLGLSREEAAKFGFLLSVPIIFGAGLKKFLDLGVSGALESLGIGLFVGALVAFITGLLAIHYLLRFLRNHTLLIFVIYRVALALIVLGVVYI